MTPAARPAWLALAAVLAACGGSDDPLPLVGTLERERLELTAPVAEPLVQIHVREGERVAAGALVARLDDRGARAARDAARAAVARARARLAELEAGPRPQALAAARARLRGAAETVATRERTFERVRRLAARDLAAPEEVDAAERALAAARAERDAAAAGLDELEAGTRAEVLEQARAELAAARAELEAAERRLAEHALASPVDATVEALPFAVGERPRAGDPVAVLLAGSPYALVYVPAALRPRLAEGMEARVTVAGGAAHAARVRTIADEAAFTPFFALTERDRGRLVYRAEIALTEAPERPPVGVPVSVDFPGLE